MVPVGINPETELVEIVEIPSHKWFVGVQFHPESIKTEQGHELLVVLPLVAFHNQLMGSRNKMQAIDMGELLRNVLTERVTRSSW